MPIARTGLHSGGRLQISYSSTNTTGRLRKPLIVVEGLDLNSVSSKLKENTDYETFVTGLNNIQGYDFNGQLDDVGGYDLVYLDYTDGVDGIIRNAALLEDALLNFINTEKRANGSTQQNVILGISMGGLVSRYCLANMTKRNLNPETRLLITQDSPHRGANAMLGLQHIVNVASDIPFTSGPIRITLGNIVPKIGAAARANRTPGAIDQLFSSLYR
ncbi:MAG: hypothetical protein HC892_22135 [Saprospiraceae bacterium]|nr:hypothetical protein [Saprospiraceae bacterium]